MTETKITWYGDDLLAALEGASDDALFEGAQELVDLAATKAPRRTGDLAGSGYVATAKRSTYRKAKGYHKEAKPTGEGVAVAAFAQFYARFVEYGTRRTPARPFLRPALDEARERIGSRIVVRLGRDIR